MNSTFGAGFGRFDLAADVRDDVVVSRFAILLQPDGEIPLLASVTADHPQLQAGAAGSVLRLRGWT